MKALILAAGKGTRLQINYPKALFTVNNKQLIENSLEYAKNAEVTEIIVVISDKLVMDYCGTQYKNIPVTYVFQHEQKGVVDAISCAEKAINNDDFLLLHCDEIFYSHRFDEMIKEFSRCDALIGCVWDTETNINKCYSVITDRENEYAIRLIEKPRLPNSDYPKGTGAIIFSNKVFDFVDEVPVNPIRKEKQLTDLIQCMTDDSFFGIKVFIVADKHINVNTVEDTVNI